MIVLAFFMNSCSDVSARLQELLGFWAWLCAFLDMQELWPWRAGLAKATCSRSRCPNLTGVLRTDRSRSFPLPLPAGLCTESRLQYPGPCFSQSLLCRCPYWIFAFSPACAEKSHAYMAPQLAPDISAGPLELFWTLAMLRALWPVA